MKKPVSVLSTFTAFLIACTALAVSACDNKGDGPAPDATPPEADAMALDATPPDAAPPSGHVTVIGNNITSATGKVILAFVGSSPPSWGAVCVPATSDPMSFTAVAKTPAQGNPCDLGDEVVFPDGVYSVFAGLFTPGEQTPSLCASTTVTVAGNGEVTLPAFGPCN